MTSSYKIEIEPNTDYIVMLDPGLRIEVNIKLIHISLLDTHVEYLIKNDANGSEQWITEQQLRSYFKADLKAVTRGFQ